MYLEIGLAIERIAGNQRYGVSSCCFIYIIIFTMHEKQTAREAYLESPQRYMMELFCERAKDFKL